MSANPQPETAYMGPVSPIVGREAERVLLREQVGEAWHGSGRLVIVGGEAGIGKTTLCRDVIGFARQQGFRSLIGHNYELMVAAPYGMWFDLADAYRRRATDDGSPDPPKALSEAGFQELTSQSEMFSQVLAFLRQLTDQGPVLLVLEDVHWADPGSLELLRFVAARLSDMRLLLMATYRMDEVTRQHPFARQLPALLRESEGFPLELRQLTRSDLADLVEARYAMPSAPSGQLADYLAAHSDGNPFFAVELLRALEIQPASGLIASNGAWEMRGLEQVVLPDLLKQVIDIRVARLGESTRGPLAVAAVIGQEVAFDLWAEVAGITHDQLVEIVELGVELSLFQSSQDGTRVRFVHALTREAIYDEIVPARRRLIHEQVARTLIRSRPHEPDPIAFHLQQAVAPDAVDWLIRAGERAQRAYAWISAHDRFITAANLLEQRQGAEQLRARLLYRCGRLLRYSDAANGIESLRLAARLAEQVGDRVLALDAVYSCALLNCFADEWGIGVPDMADAIAASEALPMEEARDSWTTVNWMADALPSIELPPWSELDPAASTLIAAGINHRRGGLPWFLGAVGRAAEAEEMARTYLGLVEGIESGPLVLSATGHASFGLAMALGILGRPGEAREAYARARGVYARLDHHAVMAFTRLTELTDVVIPYFTHDVAERHRLARESELALQRSGGALPTGSSPRRAHLVSLYVDGNWDEARAIALDGTIHGSYILRRQVTRSLTPIALHQGNIEEAWHLIHEVLPNGPDTAPGSAVYADALLLQHIAIELCLDDVDLEGAGTWLLANRTWLDFGSAPFGEAEHLIGASRIAAAESDFDRAATLAREAIIRASDPDQPLAKMQAHRVLGQALLDKGNVPEAHDAFSTALAIAERIDMPFELALCQMGLASSLQLADSPRRIELLVKARSVFTSLGARGALARAESLIGDGRGATIQPDIQTILTNRERDVLRLVASGMTDMEIGEQLFISSRTVSQHLRSVYGKLGLRTRAAATRYAMEHGLD